MSGFLEEVLARYDFSAGNEHELSFVKGERLMIVSRETENWWRAKNSRGLSGMIPSTYVKPSFSAQGQSGREDGVAEEKSGVSIKESLPSSSSSSSSRAAISSRRLSLSAGVLDTVELIAEVEKTNTKGSLRVSIEPRGTSTKVRKLKSIEEFAAFDEQIRFIADDDGLEALARVAALQKEGVRQALARVDAKQLEEWLQALVDTPSLRALAIAFCKGGRVSGDLELLKSAQQEEEDVEENEGNDTETAAPPHQMVRAKALWDFSPSSESELGLAEGDLIDIAVPEGADILSDPDAVLKTEATDGWLLGRSERSKEVGYFPAAYVKAVNTKESHAKPILIKDTQKHDKIDTPKKTNASSRTSRPVSIRSLAAYDALEVTGVAVEKFSNSAGGRRIQDGDVVTARCTASAWDGGSGLSTPFASTDWDGFTHLILKVGANDAATEGLHFALRGLSMGDTARITCAPNMAYGDAGLPGAVPQGSFLIYDLTILDVSDHHASKYQQPSGPQEIIARPAKALDEYGPKLGRVVSQRKRLTVNNETTNPSRANNSPPFRQLSTHQEAPDED